MRVYKLKENLPVFTIVSIHKMGTFTGRYLCIEWFYKTRSIIPTNIIRKFRR